MALALGLLLQEACHLCKAMSDGAGMGQHPYSIRSWQVPMAPALGLLLHECCYESYNERWAADGDGGRRANGCRRRRSARSGR